MNRIFACNFSWSWRCLAATVLLGICASMQTLAEEALTAEELAAVRAVEAARVKSIEKVYGAVVAIYGNDRQGGGSGVLYDEAGYALTNFHVVSGAGEEGWAGLADGNLYRWKLLGFDPGGDLAIIRLLGKERFPFARIGDSGRVQVGDWAMAMGNPFTLADDQKPTVTLGIVSAIERYQPGSGKNALVYGNCIQVDSSINPGNSGGPLFNMASEVIGINGRASFEERGRVNVGVGYAISSEQAKNFLPDLIATKVCMHGTLDAVFGEREGQTVCTRINLDSRAAKLGLQLGDRLVAFNSQPIVDTNQFTNLISTLPAGWPVEVVVARDNDEHRFWLRLDGLPYEQRLLEGEKAKPAPEGGEPEDGPSAEPGPTPGAPGRAPQDAAPKVEPQAAPGEIRNADINRQECERLLRTVAAQMTAEFPELAQLRAVRLHVEMRDPSFGAAAIDERSWTWSIDGRFREDHLDVDSHQPTQIAYGYDGQVFWRRDANGTVATREGDDFDLQRAEHLPLLALAALCQADPVNAFSELQLQGSDKAAGQRAFRIRGKLKSGPVLLLWFSIFSPEGELRPRLLKVAADSEDEEIGTSGWLMSPWPQSGSASRATVFTLTEGLAEEPSIQQTVHSLQVFREELPADQLGKPVDAAISE